MKNVIVITVGDDRQVYRNLRVACQEVGLNYYTVRKKQFPLHYKGFLIEKKLLI